MGGLFAPCLVLLLGPSGGGDAEGRWAFECHGGSSGIGQRGNVVIQHCGEGEKFKMQTNGMDVALHLTPESKSLLLHSDVTSKITRDCCTAWEILVD